MSKGKLSCICIAAFVAAAITAAWTSAALAVVFSLTTTACTGGANIAFCYENASLEKLELQGEQSEKLEGGAAVFTVKLIPEEKIDCEKSKSGGTVLQEEPLVLGKKTTVNVNRMVYEGCKLATAPAPDCVIAANTETTALEGILESEETLTVKPALGTAFITFTYANNPPHPSCPAGLLGEHVCTGTISILFVKPGIPEATKGLEAVGKTIECFSIPAELSQAFTMSFTELGDSFYVSKVA